MAVTEKLVPTGNIQAQNYSVKDDSLIRSVVTNRNFGLPEDYIEAHIYNANDELLASNYAFSNYYTSTNSQIKANNTVNQLYLNPVDDLSEAGYSTGILKVSYNFLRKYFSSSPDVNFFIKEISSDRKELRLSSNEISNADILKGFNQFIDEFNNLSYYKDFVINFGDNNLVIGVNIALDTNTTPNSILVKLYEPLPLDLGLKSICWITEYISDSTTYEVSFIPEEVEVITPFLRGPNFDINVIDTHNASTPFLNYNQLFTTSVTNSFQQTSNLLSEKGVDVNVDYTDFNNFVHFSSAKERLLNFAYKLELIEGYQTDIHSTQLAITGSTSSSYAVSSSISLLQTNIDNIVKKFDGYEYFLYYESDSLAWPKQTSFKPYQLYSVTSSQAITWLGSDDEANPNFGGRLFTASLYDNENADNLIYTIPSYLLEDPQNESYELFLNMIGQHFDNIWVYGKAITDLYNANNSVYQGISKDLVSYALRSLGMKLYTNNFGGDDIFQSLLGVTPSGSYLMATSSFETLVTASINGLTFYSTPSDEINKEIYKRLYHNVPYLLKSKGTERGLRALIACYGIPDTILRINEFGGGDSLSSSFDQFYNRFSYALDLDGTAFCRVPWAPSHYKAVSSRNVEIVPDVVEFRFKPYHPTGSKTQTLFQVNSGSNSQFGMVLRYDAVSATGSFQDYGNVDFVLCDSSNTNNFISCSVYLPVFNGDWWNLLVYRETGSIDRQSTTVSNTYRLFVKNAYYNGHDGQKVGYQASASIIHPGTNYEVSWLKYSTSSFIGTIGGNGVLSTVSTTQFSGAFQEYRNYVAGGTTTTSSANPTSIALPESSFNYHVMSPESFETNTITSSYTDLIFRLPLGDDLLTYDHNTAPLYFSVHPTYSSSLQSIPSTGSFLMSSSFSVGSLYGIAIYGTDIYGATTGLQGQVVVSWGIMTAFNNVPNYKINEEWVYLDTPRTGLNKRVTNKIRIYPSSDTITGSLSSSLSGSVLSPYTSIERKSLVTDQDLHMLEVALSPSDEVSDDIIAQFGHFNIDDYIGDPRQEGDPEYKNLTILRNFYFQKHIERYNLFDYIRLIKYFDNSLFKMIKDYVPGRSNLSTGIIIKPNILEKPKIKRRTPEFSSLLITSSIDVGDYSADDGGILYNIKNFLIGGNFT
jgi:hypothetical protein